MTRLSSPEAASLTRPGCWEATPRRLPRPSARRSLRPAVSSTSSTSTRLPTPRRRKTGWPRRRASAISAPTTTCSRLRSRIAATTSTRVAHAHSRCRRCNRLAAAPSNPPCKKRTGSELRSELPTSLRSANQRVPVLPRMARRESAHPVGVLSGPSLGSVLPLLFLSSCSAAVKYSSEPPPPSGRGAVGPALQQSPPPPPSVDELRLQAGKALVGADDAIRASEDEVGFAVASYGEEATAPFRAAIADAKSQMSQAFALQQLLDDEIPDTDEQRRQWYTQILQFTSTARQALADQEKNFDELRSLQQNAASALSAIEIQADSAAATIAPAAERLAGLQPTYSARALAPIADNPAQAASRMSFARTAIESAKTAPQQGTSAEAAVNIRAAEEAIDQTKILTAAVERVATDLAAADAAIAASLADIANDVSVGRTMQDKSVRELADRVGVEIETVRGLAEQPDRDPFTLSARLSKLNNTIDNAISQARDAAEGKARATSELGRTLAAARAQVQAVEDYIVARRGAVGPEARTRLSEAGRLGAEAERLASSDPATALASAQRAQQLAASAQQLAQEDVGAFNGGGGVLDGMGGRRGGGSDIFGAVLGGILINSIFSGGNNGGGVVRGGGGGVTSLEGYSAVFLSTRSSAAATTAAASLAAGAADSHPVGSAEVTLEEEALVTAEAFSPNIPRALRRHCILTVTAQASLVSTAHTR